MEPDEIFDETNERIQRALNEAKRRELEEKFGAHFGGTSKLPPEIESQWLHNIGEFERLHENAKMVKVHAFVGNPTFTPLSELSEGAIPEELDKVLDYLSEHGINVSFLAEVPPAEAYRFATEELMAEEIEDLHLEGWTSNFIYEEFHPNLELDANQFAEEFLWHLFGRKLEYAIQNFAEDEIYDSHGNRTDHATMKSRIESFFSRFAAFPSSNHTVVGCEITSEDSAVVSLKSEWSGILAETMQQQSFSGITKMKMKRSPYGGCDVVQANVFGVDL
ncbi:MAG: hypothetical protein HYY49_11905 [Ignavibacteriales bacterium]|nr:hypothetical protein [Ignavibacteriales bacterium]